MTLTLRKFNRLPPLVKIILGIFLFFFLLQKNPSPQTANPNPTPTPNQATATPPITNNPKPSLTFTKVIRVVDGDTIQIEGGKIVRYIGVDTPETVDPRKSVQCFGREASDKNKELVLGQTVGLEKDVSETDKYGRLLRYVYLGETMINWQLVNEGFASVASFPPDIKYQDLFLTAEKEAREKKRGLWADNACF